MWLDRGGVTENHSAMQPDTIVVALSGGVDSATAAALLVEAGHRVVGLTLRLYDAAGTVASAGGRCCGPRDLEDARQVCAHLGIPFYVVDHAREFGRAVIDDFVAEYAAGRTPNPCVRCNEHVKFGPLLRRARALGARRLATGHYARLEGGRLRRAVDEAKDQSYFLFAMPPEDRADVLFPLGAMTKDEVRGHAARLGLPVAAKPESQEICFVPDGDHAAFVAQRVAAQPGAIVTEDGAVVGAHGGVHGFTVGQRRGLRVAGGTPLYVLAVDAAARRVTVGPRASLARARVEVEDVRWPDGAPAEPFAAAVQVRHRQRAVPARVTPRPGGASVELDQPLESGAAPGQAAVFYRGDEVLGGGWIA
jgi:tRNA-specific 2-thiouridylase